MSYNLRPRNLFGRALTAISPAHSFRETSHLVETGTSLPMPPQLPVEEPLPPVHLVPPPPVVAPSDPAVARMIAPSPVPATPPPVSYSHLPPQAADLTDPVLQHCDELDSDEEMEPALEAFNRFHTHGECAGDPKKDWIAASRTKNYLMDDTCLDWLKQYYNSLGLNTEEEREMKLHSPEEYFDLHRQRTGRMQSEKSSLNVLFEKGCQFERDVETELRRRFGDEAVVSLPQPRGLEATERATAATFAQMQKGVPMILQGTLMNPANKTFGTADLLIRSDWINRVYKNQPYPEKLTKEKASMLSGDYHYLVIDLKWTTVPLRSNGLEILNAKMHKAYKGQLLIYTVALGQMQGYIPMKAFIMGKGYQFQYSRGGVRRTRKYHDCFDRLGVIDYRGWDESYFEKTMAAIAWMRMVRYEGHEWTFLPRPSVAELYPNMCNGQYDAPYHGVKKEIADQLKEITALWNVGPKHRRHAHEQGVYRYDDPKISAELLGITGPKVSKTVDRILEMVHCRDPVRKILPERIETNLHGWTERSMIELYVDFEMLQTTFDPYTHLPVTDSQSLNNLIGIIGVGFEHPVDGWTYRCFHIPELCLQDPPDCLRKEEKLLTEFGQFLAALVADVGDRHRVTDRKRLRPRLFHWGHAEVSTLRAANARHHGRFDALLNEIDWLDFLSVFKAEPIVVKGALKFGLKEIANAMHHHGMIATKWADDGPGGGMAAMQQMINYYNYGHRYRNGDSSFSTEFEKAVGEFARVIDYNEIDCRVVWEIVAYLRQNHLPKDDDRF